MEEVSNQGAVYEETQTQQESASPQTETEREQPESTNQATAGDLPDQQNNGWIRKVRRDRDEAIRRAQEAERKSQMQEELIRQMTTKFTPQAAAESEDILSEIEREEYVPGEKVAKALKKQQEQFNKQLEELKQSQKRQELSKEEERLRNTYSDIDDVVNPDTLDMLKEKNPTLFRRVANLLQVDPIDGAVFAYETIVSQGIAEQVPGIRRKKEVEKKLEENKKTVQSPQVFSKRPMAQAMQYPETKEAKKALWEETMRYANQGGGGY